MLEIEGASFPQWSDSPLSQFNIWHLFPADGSRSNSRTKGFRRRPRQPACSTYFICGEGGFINRNATQRSTGNGRRFEIPTWTSKNRIKISSRNLDHKWTIDFFYVVRASKRTGKGSEWYETTDWRAFKAFSWYSFAISTIKFGTFLSCSRFVLLGLIIEIPIFRLISRKILSLILWNKRGTSMSKMSLPKITSFEGRVSFHYFE